eukprot:CAMPEP_0174262648 /NCGR_PEP_ID=MMETSP0439-20130205/14370_1 /TAXON_ID=0 /ORGANISM="Stereomyxa ramosa, Strain Chinc5" /LENGTH=403 /DNA_ID=CAMNT_0015347481 /DNA_START=131 /DNA_END=1339 /DNA_ORIENTATION=+
MFCAEVERISQCFSTALDADTKRLIYLQKKARSVDMKKDNRTALIELEKEVSELYDHMLSLEKFTSLNVTGLSKILKKYDKQSGLGRKPYYLTNVVMRQPFYQSNTLNSAIEKIYALLVNIAVNIGEGFALHQENTSPSKEGKSSEEMSKEGVEALHTAAAEGDIDYLKLILDHQTNPVDSIEATLRQTASHKACISGSVECLKLLLDQGAHVNYQDITGRTPLHLSAYKCHSDCINALLSVNGVNINEEDESGKTPLHLLCCSPSERIDALQALIEAGANINQKDGKGKTPLMCAASFGNVQFVKILLENDADAFAKDLQHKTVLHCAASRNQLRTAEAVLEFPKITFKKSRLNAVDLQGNSALHIAASKGHREVVKLLVNQDGIDLQLKNSLELTPKDVAV